MKSKTNEEKAEQYELLQPLLNGLYTEFKELSKKKPDSPINTNKGNIVNRVLNPTKDLLSGESVVAYLDILDLDELPTNSDVILILNQYLRATVSFKNKYYDHRAYKWRTD